MFKKLKEARGLAQARAYALCRAEMRLQREVNKVKNRDEFIAERERYIADLKAKIVDLENNIELLVADRNNNN